MCCLSVVQLAVTQVLVETVSCTIIYPMRLRRLPHLMADMFCTFILYHKCQQLSILLLNCIYSACRFGSTVDYADTAAALDLRRGMSATLEHSKKLNCIPFLVLMFLP
jgi:hypothetical protein